MLALRVLVALGETEVDDVDEVLCRFTGADQEVVWFDISVDDTLFVNFLDSLDLINRKNK